MLKITIPALELYDEKNQLFVTQDEVKLELEHSLVSLSNWESEWEKPFLSSEQKSTEETLSYVKHMTLTDDVPTEVFNRLTNENLAQINKYIDAKMSATWFKEKPSAPSREVITAEIIYYWMVAHTIDWQAQYWHLNKLFTLIKVCNQKNAPPKKRSQRDLVAERQRINAERKAKMQTSG